VFTLYHDTDRALVRLLVAACPSTYLQALRDPVYGFGPTTTLQMLTHLTATYGTCTISDRNTNMQTMLAPWSPPTPIEHLFQQLADGARAAADNGEPIPVTQQALNGYNIINRTGLFAQGCREWRLLPPADQTYVRFVAHFTHQNQERLDSIPTTTTAGYHGYAMAVTNQPAQPDVTALMKEMLLLRATVARLSIPPPTPNRTAGTDTTSPRGYCWTHGSSRNLLHTSATCKAPAPGHVTTATATNPCGGSTKIWVTARPPRAPPTQAPLP
jgi:hypothetical protein